MRKLSRSLCFYIVCLIGFINSFAYSNTSPPNNTPTSKIIDYIESKKKLVEGNVFCVGQDKIDYFETFFDEERDYFGLNLNEKMQTNLTIADNRKQPEPSSIEIMLEHNPNVYQNAVSVSGISNHWYIGKVVWDSEKSKWRFNDTTNSILFKEPSDDKRGEWTVHLKAKDSTGKDVFNKSSQGSATFRVHKAPIPKFSFSENASVAYLSDAGSYDYDGMYKGTAQDYQNTKGIKQYYWSVKMNGNWVDVGAGKSVSFNKSGPVTDYRLTVEDFDGVTASVSKNSLILEKPIVEFNIKVNNIVDDYFYRGNVGHESLSVEDKISWMDDAFVPGLYNTSGSRTLKWIGVTNRYMTDNTNTLISALNSSTNNFVNSQNKLALELEAKNKYDLAATKLKSIDAIDIMGNLSLTSDTLIEGKFIPGTDGKIKFTNINSKVNNEEIEVKLSGLGLQGKVLKHISNTSEFNLDFTFPDYSITGNSSSYTVDIYSKRGGQHLHRLTGTANFIVPLSLDFVGTQYYIPDNKTHIDIKTNKYVNRVEVHLFDGTSYKHMVPSCTKFSDDGTTRHWTVSYKPPKDIPLKVYKVKAIGHGVGGLTIEKIADLHYIDLVGKVKHTDTWNLNRQKYNKSKTGDENSPRDYNLFFNGEKFLLESNLNTSVDSEFKLTSVNVSMLDYKFKSKLNKISELFKGDMYDKTFKTLWSKPNVYPLTFKFDGLVNDSIQLSDEVKVFVDSKDTYWRDHLKD